MPRYAPWVVQRRASVLGAGIPRMTERGKRMYLTPFPRREPIASMPDHAPVDRRPERDGPALTLS